MEQPPEEGAEQPKEPVKKTGKGSRGGKGKAAKPKAGKKPVVDKSEEPEEPGKEEAPQPEGAAGAETAAVEVEPKPAQPEVPDKPAEGEGAVEGGGPAEAEAAEEGVPPPPGEVEEVVLEPPAEPPAAYAPRKPEKGEWVPKTRLGRMVKDGKITTMAEALRTGYPLREPEVVDILLPELDDEVLDVNMVQRMTDSGRRVRFAIVTVVGNTDGYVGLGKATGKEVGPAIRKSIDNAKLNIIEIKRGCGSWECGCGQPHSIPFVIKGKSGSAEVTFKPAPRGISLAVGDVAKHILRLAGVNDAWGFTAGKTRTTVNYAKAAFEALKKISEMRVMPEQEQRLHIHTGSIGTQEEGVDE